MKPFNICLSIIIALTSLTLTACDPLKGYGQEAGAGGSKRSGLQNARGGDVWGCQGEQISGLGFLDRYGLPREIGGNFICDGDTPKLPKDCQGKEFRSEAELRAYWEKYQLPVGLIHFDCTSGTPRIPAIQLETWKQDEKYDPTCKDARGRKRPCV
ncbi:hypothetical protein [Pelistega suis]|uniref:Lipoprotein n=1 Tax=Pelistega suis TaxID=1631957 RepID=A0A849P5P2_9BURK|nr:hypothetical protein [Pelistega suis]NOL51102.1 hypothetical protein [Pelistega suis]